MSLVHRIDPCNPTLSRIVSGVQDCRWGLGAGLALAALAGAPMPLPQISLAGPVVATVVAGRAGGRAAAAVGFLSFLVLHRPSAPVAASAGALALLVGWAVPSLLRWLGVVEDGCTSAVSIDCEGFAALDKTYGEGAGDHAYRLLRRALEVEKKGSDLVVHGEDREIVLVIDGTSPAGARATMARVERRFSGWLSDAGYECDLSVGLSDPVGEAPARSNRVPYLD